MSDTEIRSHAVTLRCAFCLTLNRVDLTRAGDRPRCAECGRPFLLDRPVKVAGDDFDRLVKDAEVPVLVDFYADWCGPCKMMAPVLDDLARDRTGEVLVAKVDTDASPQLASRMGIRGIPTLAVFRDGKEAARQTGAAGRAGLDALLAEAEEEG
jgi:thioredoxin 2